MGHFTCAWSQLAIVVCLEEALLNVHEIVNVCERAYSLIAPAVSCRKHFRQSLGGMTLYKLHSIIDRQEKLLPSGCVDCITHPSILTLPDEKVYSELGWPMLNNVMQATPTHEKPSPGSARRDQTTQTR